MKSHARETHWVSITLFLAIGYVLVFGQARFTAFRDFTGVQLDFLPGLLVFAGLAFSPVVAMSAALVLGLWFDTMSANPLGTTVASLGVLTFLTVRFRDILLSDQFMTHWLLGLTASALAPIVALIAIKFTGESPLIGAGTIYQWAIMTAGGGVMTPLWFKLFNRLDDALRYKEMPESVFRQDRQIARGRH